MAAMVGGVFGIRPDRHVVAVILFELVMIALLIIVCLLKGETPDWHRGSKKRKFKRPASQPAKRPTHKGPASRDINFSRTPDRAYHQK